MTGTETEAAAGFRLATQVLALACSWNREAQALREQLAEISPQLASGHKYANLLARCAAELMAALEGREPARDGAAEFEALLAQFKAAAPEINAMPEHEQGPALEAIVAANEARFARAALEDRSGGDQVTVSAEDVKAILLIVDLYTPPQYKPSIVVDRLATAAGMPS